MSSTAVGYPSYWAYFDFAELEPLVMILETMQVFYLFKLAITALTCLLTHIGILIQVKLTKYSFLLQVCSARYSRQLLPQMAKAHNSNTHSLPVISILSRSFLAMIQALGLGA